MNSPQKQQLLNKEEFQKQLRQKQQKAAIDKQQALIKQKMAQIQAAQAAQAPVVAKKPSKAKWYFLALLALVAALLPYPKIITYEKLGVVAESIYIPSRFGSKAFLLDTNAEVQVDGQNRWLYLCNTLQGQRHCNRYDIVDTQGFFAAVGKYLEQ
ncbi:hypothetical protein DS2_14524 [Catenovulum agarivorans DS-2]|uniref:Uncharacterized protein n=1 Tax=Catenovulum agarivorans DS-2 TaxID=1328313 RepID=W7QJ80_9ALTE|nr:hypothetical protein [Catenovulum agarivorans]EWH08997.1 hypothetical protein DS2_14524 [Catenovulum agarivorans DS-2]